MKLDVSNLFFISPLFMNRIEKNRQSDFESNQLMLQIWRKEIDSLPLMIYSFLLSVPPLPLPDHEIIIKYVTFDYIVLWGWGPFIDDWVRGEFEDQLHTFLFIRTKSIRTLRLKYCENLRTLLSKQAILN